QVGIEQLFNQLLRPKLRNLISDVYKDVSYTLDEESYANAEYHDIVRKRFVKTWESLLDGYKVCRSKVLASHPLPDGAQDSFTDSNFRLFFGLTLDVVLRPWEKLMVTFRFTEVRLDETAVRLLPT